MLFLGARSLRDHLRRVHPALAISFTPVIGYLVLMGLRRWWWSIAMVLVVVVGALAPLGLALRPRA